MDQEKSLIIVINGQGAVCNIQENKQQEEENEIKKRSTSGSSYKMKENMKNMGGELEEK